MRFHFLMLVIVILVSLGMHGLASAGAADDDAGYARAVPPLASGAAAPLSH